MATKRKPKIKVLPVKEDRFEAIPDDSEIAKFTRPLSFRQKAWADAFIKTLNKKKASLLIGCSDEGASSYGCMMWDKPAVREYIEYLVTAAIGSVDDNIKLVQSIRDARMGDYLKRVKVTRSDLIKVPLSKVIAEHREELEMEGEWLWELTDPKMITASMQKLASLRLGIKKMELELKYKPKATRIVHGPTYLTDDIELDLVKLAEDKEHGLIKALKTTKEGVQVELYSSLEAANTLARIQGADKGSAPVTNINTGPTAEQLAKLTPDQLRAMAAIEKVMKA